MGGHSEGVQVGKFCAYRTNKCKEPCNTGNEYQKNCTPPPDGWADDFFYQGRTRATKKRFEAHHLLCIASVTELVANKKEIKNIVMQTEWCINAKINMFAMPLWGHTIKWYCSLPEAGAHKDQWRRPKFENVPQHDYDHNSNKGYKKTDVDPALKELANQIEEMATENHEVAEKELKEELDFLAAEARTMLQKRGKRSDGTHNAWEQGKDRPDSDWYLPFSMASTAGAEKRVFPAPGFKGKTAEKIKRLVKAYLTWGAT